MGYNSLVLSNLNIPNENTLMTSP